MNTKSKLSCNNLKVKSKETVSPKQSDIIFESQEKITTNNTALTRKTLTKDEDDGPLSPFFMRFTQDIGDGELDVVWDWDSPKSKGDRNLHRKRILHSSPKIPKKQVPVDNLPRFNSLKAELEELANKLNDEITENSNNHLWLESEAKNDTLGQLSLESEDIFIKPITPITSAENNDFFDDDSLNDEMIKCSQQAEEVYNLNKWCNSIINKNKELKADNKIEDDSFDIFLEEIKDEDIEKLSQASSSSGNCSQHKPNLAVPSPRSICRTNSVPIKPCTVTTSLISKTRSEEIGKSERIHCSPEEIEKKRQEAKIRLEFRRKQHEIEKKRLVALERKRNRLQKCLSQNANLRKPLNR